MANAPVTKYQVIAKCIQIMTNQMRDSRHPEMKRRLREKIDYFSSFGVADSYQMIVYSNSIILVHNDFKNYPNLNLFDNGKLYIGRFDATLAINDPQCIRIHGNGSADSGTCVHGYVEGECITENLVREKGKEVRYKYEGNNPYSAVVNDSKRVKNDMSLPLFKRLLKNETIGQGDFFKGILCVIGVGLILTSIGLDFLIIIPGIFLIYITYKRIGDLGYSGGKAIVILVLCYMLHMLGLIILCAMPSKVVSESEYKLTEDKLIQELAIAEKSLKARCNVYNGPISWLLINAETLRIASSLAGTSDKTSHSLRSESYGDDARQREEEELREEEERIRQEEEELREEEERQRQAEEELREEEERAMQISNLESQISSLESQISSLQSAAYSAESQATSRRQQGETYLSYANSTQDEAQRNDYLQSADSCFSEVAQYENEAAATYSEINNLQSEINSLQSELNQL